MLKMQEQEEFTAYRTIYTVTQTDLWPILTSVQICHYLIDNTVESQHFFHIFKNNIGVAHPLVQYSWHPMYKCWKSLANF